MVPVTGMALEQALAWLLELVPVLVRVSAQVRHRQRAL